MKEYPEVAEKSLNLHAQKYNCAQSVLCSLSGRTGLDEKTSKAVSAGFGGGLRCGEVCGAAAGAVMALGLAADGDAAGSKDDPIADRTRKFTAAFREKFGALRCDELLQTAGGHGRCDEFISYSAQLAAAIIDEDMDNNKN